PYGGALVVGHLLDQGQESQLDALAVLSRSRVNLVTLVILQICTPEIPVDEGQLRAADLLVAALENSRPEALDPAAQERPVEVLLLNLMAAPTGMAGVPQGRLISRAYSANLVASPEDRRAADQMDRFVRPRENLVTWAMAQAVTVAGIWSGLYEGPWRLLRVWGGTEDSALSQGDFARPMRSFARVVTSAPTARRALALAMEDVRHQQGNALVSDRLVPQTDPSTTLDRTLEAFDSVDGRRLDYATPPGTAGPGRARVPLFRAVADFLRFSSREIAQIPRFVVNRSSAKVSARATEALSGEEGSQEVTFRGETSDLTVYTDDFEQQSIEAQHRLDDVSASLPPAAPELWRTLRQTVFGLLDGSPIPEPIPTPIVADQRVVVPATTLIVPPPFPWAPSIQDVDEAATDLGFDGLFIPACSPWQADWVRDDLAAHQAEEEQTAVAARTRAQQVTDELLALESAPESERSPVAAPGVNAASTGGRPEAFCPDCGDRWRAGIAYCPGCGREVTIEESTPTVDPASPPTTGPRSVGEPLIDSGDNDATAAAPQLVPEAPTSARSAQLAAARVAAQRADEEVASANRRVTELSRQTELLETWIRDRDKSLLWRLAQRVQQRTLQAAADSEEFYSLAVTIPQVDADEPRRARNQFAKRFLLMCSVALLLIVLTAVLATLISDSLPLPTWILWVIVILVVLVWLLIILLSYHRRRSRFVAQLRLLRHQQRDAQRRCVESRLAESKLKGLYEQLVEWGEILGYVVHDPWRPDPDWFSGMPSADLAANLPTCVDLAVPDPDDDVGTRRLQRTALATLAGEGWRTRSFNLMVDLALRERALGDGAIDAALLDLDAPATPNGSRSLMLDMLRAGHLQEDAARNVIRTKAATLYAERETLTSHTLRPVNSEYAAEATDLLDVGGQLELLRPTWGDFLSGVLDGSTQFSHALWSDMGRAVGDVRHHMRTLLFTPPGMSVGAPPQGAQVVEASAADRNRGVEVAVRCDFGPTTETVHLRL
ncbi:MAG: hypothetical protein QG597_4989, partial [Actinomycetota bacterium]|nr:hypothetical protein [Actinomycetota bacterium]